MLNKIVFDVSFLLLIEGKCLELVHGVIVDS